MGTSALRNVDPRSVSWQRNLPGAGSRRRKSPKDAMETGKHGLCLYNKHAANFSDSRVISANRRWAHVFNAVTNHASKLSTSLVLAELDYACA